VRVHQQLSGGAGDFDSPRDEGIEELRVVLTLIVDDNYFSEYRRNSLLN